MLPRVEVLVVLAKVVLWDGAGWAIVIAYYLFLYCFFVFTNSAWSVALGLVFAGIYLL